MKQHDLFAVFLVLTAISFGGALVGFAYDHHGQLLTGWLGILVFGLGAGRAYAKIGDPHAKN